MRGFIYSIFQHNVCLIKIRSKHICLLRIFMRQTLQAHRMIQVWSCNLSSSYLLVYLWGRLLLFCGFIGWDTQMIIEKRKRGDRDLFKHSLDLFIDLMQVFRRVIVLRMQKVIHKFTSQSCFYKMPRFFIVLKTVDHYILLLNTSCKK